MTVGLDIDRASVRCPHVFVNCRAGEHRTGAACVAALWIIPWTRYLAKSCATIQAVLLFSGILYGSAGEHETDRVC